jgi:hypothetical protein
VSLRTAAIVDLMEETGYSREFFYRLVEQKAVAVVRASKRGRIRIVRESWDAWLQAHLQPAEPTTTTDAPSVDADRELPALDSDVRELFGR